MEQYKIIFIKHIYSSFASWSKNDIFLKREFKINFIPQNGITFISELFEEKINSLEYDIDSNVFKTYSEDKEIHDKDLKNIEGFYHKTEDAKKRLYEIVNEYKSMGWEVLP